MISAEVICDSVSPQNIRLTTFKLRYPRFIHAEFMTHRVFSRNASSSRAVPTAKLIEEVRSDALRAAPIFWGKNQKGMQAVEELSSKKDLQDPKNVYGPEISELEMAQRLWAGAAFWATRQAEALVDLGAHKQIVNRILEPFLHINVICTATDYDNFFGLRLHKDAQPEMQALARAMYGEMQASKPESLEPGEWHLPFVGQVSFDGDIHIDHQSYVDIGTAIKVSVARCARVSYQSFETGKRSTVEEDLALYEKLMGVQPFHASPAEHQATPDDVGGPFDIIVNEELTEEQKANREMPMTITGRWANHQQHGNFTGWRQYRKMLKDEACAPMPEGYR